MDHKGGDFFGSFWLSAFAALVFLTSPVRGDVIYETEDPFGGPFGLWGYDVCIQQSVALRFTPEADYRLSRLSLWFMNNDFSGQTHPLVVLTLRTDDDSVPGVSIPSEEIIESQTFTVSAIGWNPVLETVESKANPLLRPGVHYWIAVASEAPCGADGVWNIASFGVGFMSNTDGAQDNWSPGGSSAVTATVIEATPAIAGDVDFDGDVDLSDFAAFEECRTGPGSLGIPGSCTPFDFDVDRDVDMSDYAVFQMVFTGPR